MLRGPLSPFEMDPRFAEAIKAAMDAAEPVDAIAPEPAKPASPDSPPELHRALAYVGLFTRVAKTEGLSVGHVTEVAKGRRTSKRVLDAIVREVRRIERSSERAA